MTTPSPAILHIAADEADRSVALAAWILEIRASSDGLVVIGGGAAKMSPPVKHDLLHLLDALRLLAATGMRFAVGDGGTRAGVMEGTGIARRASGGAFPLIGVAPAPEIIPTDEEGKTPIDPNHSHIVAVDNAEWETAQAARSWTPADSYWGAETGPMYRLFARLSEGRPSVAIIANGGVGTLDEVKANVDAERPIILIAGSGRAADVVVSLLQGVPLTGGDPEQLAERAAELELPLTRRDLYHVFELSAGPQALCRLLQQHLSPS